MKNVKKENNKMEKAGNFMGSFDRRKFVRKTFALLGAGAFAKLTTGCSPTDEEEEIIDDPNNGNGNGNGNGNSNGNGNGNGGNPTPTPNPNPNPNPTDPDPDPDPDPEPGPTITNAQYRLAVDRYIKGLEGKSHTIAEAAELAFAYAKSLNKDHKKKAHFKARLFAIGNNQGLVDSVILGVSTVDDNTECAELVATKELVQLSPQSSNLDIIFQCPKIEQ